MMKAPLIRRARARDASTRRGGGFGLDDDDAGVSSLPPRRWRRGARDRRARRRRREARARDDRDDAVDDDARFDIGRAVVVLVYRSRVAVRRVVARVRGRGCAASRRAVGVGGAVAERGGGGAGGDPSAVNAELKAARRADEILSIVAARGERLDFVNVATAVNTLYKVANARDNLRGDPRYARLLELVRRRCRAFRARQVANVVHGLGVLCADRGAGDVDAETAGELMRAVEREIDSMDPSGGRERLQRPDEAPRGGGGHVSGAMETPL